jgi:hypothetical protein
MRRSGPLPPGRAVWIISQVASALDAAHAAGLVHRDVKPGNMLVDAQPGRPDHVYLSDFGLSKGALSTSVGLTGVGQFLGTVDYISPEQIEGKPVDGRADEYALACATFEMLTGAPPFRRDEAMAVMYAQLSEPPPLVTSQRPDLPPAADQVFARALAKAPAQRYASCREFADALRGAFGLAPYDSGPGVITAAGHPPTQAAWPAAGGARPTREEGIPASLAAATVPGHLGPGTGGGPQPGDRRLSPATLAGISALAVAGIAAAVIFAILPGHGPVSYSKHAGSPTPTMTQAAKAAPSKTPRAAVTPTVAPPVTVPATTAPPTTAPPTTAPPTTLPTTPSPTTTPSGTASPTASPSVGTSG